jgi:hypothetical protein
MRGIPLFPPAGENKKVSIKDRQQAEADLYLGFF